MGPPMILNVPEYLDPSVKVEAVMLSSLGQLYLERCEYVKNQNEQVLKQLRKVSEAEQDM
jgi:hypothetical protein